jgi:ankyrin repeat protein
LFRCIRSGDILGVTQAVNEGALINQQREIPQQSLRTILGTVNLDETDASHCNRTNSLGWALFYKQTKIARFLLDSGADQNAPCFRCLPPIIMASHANEPLVALKLRDMGAYLNITTCCKSQSALFFARTGDMVCLLVKMGVRATIDRRGRTPLHQAIGADYCTKKLIKALVHFCRVNHQDNDGRTPLALLASLKNRPDLASVLLDHGANANIADNLNITPGQLLREREIQEIERSLESAAADPNDSDSELETDDLDEN